MDLLQLERIIFVGSRSTVENWSNAQYYTTSFCRKEAISEELCMFESHSMSNLEPIITEHYLCSVEKNDIDTQVYINLAIVISKQKLSLSVLALILNSSRNIVVVASVVVLKCGSRDDAKVAKKNTNRYIH